LARQARYESRTLRGVERGPQPHLGKHGDYSMSQIVEPQAGGQRHPAPCTPRRVQLSGASRLDPSWRQPPCKRALPDEGTVAPSMKNGTMAPKRCADVCRSSHAPNAPPAMLGIVNQTSQRRAPVNSPRYADMLPTAPGHSATVLVAFATSGAPRASRWPGMSPACRHQRPS